MFSDRVQAISESGSISLAGKIAELRKAGHPIISLSIGEPDFLPHKDILEATASAINRGEVRYSAVQGVPELRELIAQRARDVQNIPAVAKNVLVSNGSKQILYNIFQALLNPGDEVIVPIPYWVTFPEAIKLAGGVPVFTPCGLRPLAQEIASQITSKTKAIILNSPNNPSGMMIEESELRKLAEIVLSRNLMLISDEAYEAFYYNTPPLAPASLSQEMFDQTFTVQSFSKTFGMTGFRIGHVIAHEKWIQTISKLQGHLTGNNCTFAQYGAVQALSLDHSITEEYRQDFLIRRNQAFERCRKIFDCERPDGAFYLFPSIRPFLQSNRFKSDQELALHLLDKANVAILPGSFFGEPNHLRISFAASLQDIHEAFDRIEKVL